MLGPPERQVQTLLPETQLFVLSASTPLPCTAGCICGPAAVLECRLPGAGCCLRDQRPSPTRQETQGSQGCVLKETHLCNRAFLLLNLSPAQEPASPGAPDLLQDQSRREVCFSGLCWFQGTETHFPGLRPRGKYGHPRASLLFSSFHCPSETAPFSGRLGSSRLSSGTLASLGRRGWLSPSPARSCPRRESCGHPNPEG